ncbi:hypothetical protein, partial [Methylobacterium sp. WL103]|uniref:hypothetical protein n=1 Tax=Methylobacterium sp. WL103 TaxID=2603891 RepID=UPI001AEF1D06
MSAIVGAASWISGAFASAVFASEAFVSDDGASAFALASSGAAAASSALPWSDAEGPPSSFAASVGGGAAASWTVAGFVSDGASAVGRAVSASRVTGPVEAVAGRGVPKPVRCGLAFAGAAGQSAAATR